ncbi:unnamed protein product [Auanema sp. JU1783]|nr:unnamed protein product [Auanema sp. JU1783]
MLNCDTICLLATAVAFSKSPSTSVCNYCVDTRSTDSECFDNIIECAYKDPASLIFCLNVYEKSDSMIDHSLRCISYKQFFILDEQIVQLGGNGVCSYDDGLKCNCSSCPYIENAVVVNNTDSYDDTIVSHPVTEVSNKQHFRGRAKHIGLHQYDHHNFVKQNKSHFEQKTNNSNNYPGNMLFITMCVIVSILVIRALT